MHVNLKVNVKGRISAASEGDYDDGA